MLIAHIHSLMNLAPTLGKEDCRIYLPIHHTSQVRDTTLVLSPTFLPSVSPL